MSADTVDHIARRRALQAGAGLLAGAAAAWALPAAAKPASAAAFDASAQGHPLLAPFHGVSDATGDLSSQARLVGRWPAELRGRLHRNGPALFERNGQRYHHWFDGDGMVQQFRIDGAGVRHRGRLVRTSKLQAEQQAGRFLMSAFGTTIDDGPPAGGPDAFNTANTNAIEHGGRLLALWEGGSAYALDVDTLSTEGPVTWRSDLQQVPFSAHPKIDGQGQLWNFGTYGKHIVAWQIDAQGRLVKVQLGESPFPGGMVHDMAVTDRWLVLPLPPVKLNFGQASEGPRHFSLEPGEPLRLLVMDKSDIAKRRVFELPPQLVFHVGNAFENRQGEIVLSWVGSPDARFLDQTAVALMAGQPQPASAARLNIARLDMGSGKVDAHALPGDVEFPRVDPRRIGQPARWLACAVAWKPRADPLGATLHGVQLVDTHTGRVRRFDYGDQVIAEEHIVVPKPGRHGELDAWLLGTTFDAKRQATVLNLLDMAHIEHGPIAQAVLPYALPLGFHGNFAAA